MPRYLRLHSEVPLELAELAAAHLHEEGAEGVEVYDDEVRPPPGAPERPEGKAVVIAYFGGGVDAEAIRARLQFEIPDARVEVESLDEEPWAETWKLHFHPVRVREDFWVVPPWERPPEGADAIVIEPGMAFGTGTHESTALCLDFVPDLVREGGSVLDLGCGSGILGIAAARRGAGRVLMLDNDPVAVQVARKNADANGYPEIEASGTPVERVDETFHLVLANILAQPLIDLAPVVAARVARGGALVLSGFTLDQAPDVRRAYEAEGLVFREDRTRGEWSALHLEKAA